MIKKILFLFTVICLLSTIKAIGQTRTRAEMEAEYLQRAKTTLEYKRVYEAVKQSITYIELADKGKIKKSDVVKHYNDNLAGYMGKKSLYLDVKKRVLKDGNSLLQMVQLKEASKLALEDAAEQ